MAFSHKVIGKIIGDRKSKNRVCKDCNEEHSGKFGVCKSCLKDRGDNAMEWLQEQEYKDR